jgi:hypothetical protein
MRNFDSIFDSIRLGLVPMRMPLRFLRFVPNTFKVAAIAYGNRLLRAFFRQDRVAPLIRLSLVGIVSQL